MLCKRTLCSNRQTFATNANTETIVEIVESPSVELLPNADAGESTTFDWIVPDGTPTDSIVWRIKTDQGIVIGGDYPYPINVFVLSSAGTYTFEFEGDGFFIADTVRVLPSGEPAVQNSVAETAQIDANQYTVLESAWNQVKSEMAGDTTAQNQAEQNRSLMQLFNQLDTDSGWLIYFGTQQRVDEWKAAWASYVSWLNGKPDYLNSQGETPNGWSGYVNLFYGFNGWLSNYAPQKYKHL